MGRLGVFEADPRAVLMARLTDSTASSWPMSRSFRCSTSAGIAQPFILTQFVHRNAGHLAGPSG